jgi:isopenicillin N synthase-like dioxygenase
MDTLPIIDISAWILDKNNDRNENEKVLAAMKWDEAFSNYGFAIIIGHGIPEDKFQAINREAVDFFKKSHEDKMSYNCGYYGNPFGGYSPPGFEKVALSTGDSDSNTTKFDPVENFVFTSQPDNFFNSLDKSFVSSENLPFPSAHNYYLEMESLLRTLHSISCKALGLEDLDYFDKFYNTERSENVSMGMNGNALRLAHYLPTTTINNRNNSSTNDKILFDNEIRYGAHTDYQG